MKVIFPGSFDPVTRGHLNVIYRAAILFDQVIVAILVNNEKKSLFSTDEKIEMLNELLYDYDNISVRTFSGLLVDFVKEEKADAVVRGLRNSSDFLYERQLSLLNHSIYKEMEEIFLMTNEKYSYVSSSFAKEIASFGGDVSGLVTANVGDRLLKKYRKN